MIQSPHTIALITLGGGRFFCILRLRVEPPRRADAFGRSVQHPQRKVAECMDLFGQLAVEIVIVIERHQLAALQDISRKSGSTKKAAWSAGDPRLMTILSQRFPKIQHFLQRVVRLMRSASGPKPV
jgi:hypothetical protein